MFPNFVLDELLGTISGSEFKILSIIYRKTVGFDKKSDKISYSQFVNKTGLSKSTISQSIESLEKKGLINVDRSELTNVYAYCFPNKPIVGSSKIEQEDVQKSNYQPVRKSNTQKKRLKEKQRNTTSRDFSEDVGEVINYWNNTFPDSLDPLDSELIEHIEKSLDIFSISEIKKAIIIRSNCRWYLDEKPYLINEPNAFFPYPETIRNDLNREPNDIFNYDERNERIFKGINVDEDFEMLPNLKDQQDRAKWKLKNN